MKNKNKPIEIEEGAFDKCFLESVKCDANLLKYFNKSQNTIKEIEIMKT